MSENKNKKISLAWMRAKRNGKQKQDNNQDITIDQQSKSIENNTLEKQEIQKKPVLKIGISLKNSDKKMLSVEEESETITPLDDSEITDNSIIPTLQESEWSIVDSLWNSKDQWEEDKSTNKSGKKKLSLSWMKKSSMQDIPEDDEAISWASEEADLNKEKNIITLTDETLTEIIPSENTNKAPLLHKETISETILNEKWESWENNTNLNIDNNTEEKNTNEIIEDNTLITWDDNKKIILNEHTWEEHTTKTWIHVTPNEHAGEDEKIINPQASKKFWQLFHETNSDWKDKNNEVEDKENGEKNSKEGTIMLWDEVLLWKPKSQFSNYESDFSAKENDIMSKIKKLKYLPKTRPALVCWLIAITWLWITGLFYLDPKKHSLSNYKATLVSYYKTQTGEEDLEKIQEWLNNLQEKKQAGIEKSITNTVKTSQWNKEKMIHKWFPFTIESTVWKNSVKIFKYNNIEYTKLGDLQKVLDIEISKLKHNKVESFLLGNKKKKNETEATKQKTKTINNSNKWINQPIISDPLNDLGDKDNTINSPDEPLEQVTQDPAVEENTTWSENTNRKIANFLKK